MPSTKREMTFWTELDAQSKDMRAEAITRFAVGMDPPAEQILGMSANSGTGREQWCLSLGAWQIEESTIKMFVEPMARWLSTPFRCRISAPWHPDETDLIVSDTLSTSPAPRSLQRGHRTVAEWRYWYGHHAAENGSSLTICPMRTRSNSTSPQDRLWFGHALRREAALEAIGITLDSKRFGELGQ